MEVPTSDTIEEKPTNAHNYQLSHTVCAIRLCISRPIIYRASSNSYSIEHCYFILETS